MECKKEPSSSSSSSSSFTADLFGTKESPPPSSSTGIFASIFPPPSKVLGRKSSTSQSWQKQPSANQGWNTKQGLPAAGPAIPNKDRKSIFVEERVEPCHLSSSLYYGGQDNYSQPPNTQPSGSGPGSGSSYPIFKKDGGEDDPNGSNSNTASRGNWWQGSLYY
ncbi:uncharacterized protein [Euphorbia lathyris]|uniref:uncharacterized protein isoform X2 n=1 Tax=Euphorbia lathyris TaxID=212925 RepID=UPI00331367DD